ncbi:FYN-binding protein 1 [Osmerus mordax]|uniref:FYN-binding protein 1 n=1 Tax=Osmerus mordax TaxID=8014 RepID=UPI00350F3BD0
MEEAVDVKALRARFHAKAEISDSSRDSGSPKSPLPAFGIGGLLAEGGVTANGVARKKIPAVVPSPPPGRDSFPVVPRLPRHMRNDAGSGSSPRPQLPQGVFPRLHASTPPPPHGARTKALPPPFPPSEVAETASKVKLTGAMLQNKMLKHQGPSPAKPGSSGPPLLPSQKIRSEVVPLRRPLPPERLRPLKPKRPPHVNLDQHQGNKRVPPTPPERTGMRRTDGSSSSGSSSLSLSGLVSPTGPPRPPNKPSSLPRHHTPAFEEGDVEETYDDIDLPPPPPPHMRSFDKSESWKDSGSSQFEVESDESEVYDTIDEEQGATSSSSNRKTEREMKRLKEQELKNQEKIHKKEKEYKKKFKLSDEVMVIHTATVRHDWQGDKHDLSVQQGEIIEIIRIENNPVGMWLGRTMTGNYGYISISCVDLNYEEIKRKYRDSRQLNPFPLPPPPPDPPQDGDIYYDVDSSDHKNSMNETDEDYDDVEQLFKECPPPPLEISLDPKSEKELRTKFKLNGPIKVLHTMMVDLNANIKKPGGKDLAVVQGDILEVIQITNKKKALCRNSRGKYGYVPRAHLLQMEGDVYDDVDNINEIYDNDHVR